LADQLHRELHATRLCHIVVKEAQSCPFPLTRCMSTPDPVEVCGGERLGRRPCRDGRAVVGQCRGDRVNCQRDGYVNVYFGPMNKFGYSLGGTGGAAALNGASLAVTNTSGLAQIR
jgi:hypothetical protein